jgi:hypothetical protein
VLDLQGQVRCRGCGARGRAVVSVKCGARAGEPVRSSLPPVDLQHRNSLDFSGFLDRPPATRSATAAATAQRARSSAEVGDIPSAALALRAWPPHQARFDLRADSQRNVRRGGQRARSRLRRHDQPGACAMASPAGTSWGVWEPITWSFPRQPNQRASRDSRISLQTAERNCCIVSPAPPRPTLSQPRLSPTIPATTAGLRSALVRCPAEG